MRSSGSTRNITPGNVWIDSTENVNNFYLYGQKLVASEGQLWALPSVAIGGKGHDYYRVSSNGFAIIYDGAEGDTDNFRIDNGLIQDYTNFFQLIIGMSI